MENKPSIREERMKAGVEAGKPGAKARMEAAEAWMEAAEAGMEATAKPPWKAEDGVVEQSAIANATDVVLMAFHMDLRIVAPPKSARRRAID
jgi:hypothetical protein